MRDLEALDNALSRLEPTLAVTLLVAPADRFDAFVRMDIELVRSALGEGDSRFRVQRVCSPRTPDGATEEAFMQRIHARARALAVPVVVRARAPSGMLHFTEWLALQGPAPKRAYRVETVERWYTEDGLLHERTSAFSVEACSGNEAAQRTREAHPVIDAPCLIDAYVNLVDLGTRASLHWPTASKPEPPSHASAMRQATLSQAGIAALMQLAACRTPLDGMLALGEAWQVSPSDVHVVGAYLRGEVSAEDADSTLMPLRTRIAESLHLAELVEQALATGTLTRETWKLAEHRSIDTLRWLRSLAAVGLADAKRIARVVASMGDEAHAPGAFGRVVEESRKHGRG